MFQIPSGCSRLMTSSSSSSSSLAVPLSPSSTSTVSKMTQEIAQGVFKAKVEELTQEKTRKEIELKGIDTASEAFKKEQETHRLSLLGRITAIDNSIAAIKTDDERISGKLLEADKLIRRVLERNFPKNEADRLNAVKTNLLSKRTLNDAEQAKLSDEKHDHEIALAGMRAKLTAKMNDVQVQKTGLEQQVKDIADKITTLKTAQAILIGIRTKLLNPAEFRECTAVLAGAETQHKTNKDRLQANLDAKRAEESRLAVLKTEREKQLKSQTEALEKLKAQKEADNLENFRKSFSKNFDQCFADPKAKNAKQASIAEVVQLFNKIPELTAEQVEVQGELNKLQAEIDSIKNQIKQVDTEKTTLKTQIINVTASLKACELAKTILEQNRVKSPLPIAPAGSGASLLGPSVLNALASSFGLTYPKPNARVG